MKGLSITARMLLVALAPAVLVASMLSLWFVVDRVRDIERTEMRRARTVAEGLALASEYGVATGNQALLDEIAQPMLRIPSIARIRFVDAQGRPLLQSGERPVRSEHRGVIGTLLSPWLGELPRLKEIVQPVLRTDLSAFDDPLFAPTTDRGDGGNRRIGTLYLTVDLSRAYRRQLESIGRAFAVTALVLLAAAPAAVWLARSVSRPLRAVTEATGRLARHDYIDEVPARTGGELGELAHAVLHLSDELRSFHGRLQQAALVATNDLHHALDALERRNRELDEARSAAERASAFKSEFLANMSHEIRTPMNTIVGTLSLLARSPLSADQREQLALIDGASDTLLALIDDILDITRIETGNLPMNPVRCDLPELLREIALNASQQAVARGLELGVTALPPEGVRFIVTDPLRLKQVLYNLLSNAIKFTADGHVLLHVAVSGEGDEQVLELSVIDTGIGIPEHLHERLFAAFTQADMSSTRRYGGAGLGLHICKGIVELMGGAISVSSAPGEGTRFDVTLPFASPPEHGSSFAPAPIVMRYADGYAPLEPVVRRALALAGVLVREDPGAPVLVAVPNRLLREINAGGAPAFAPPPGTGRRIALVAQLTPDIARWLRESRFDAHVLRTPHVAELRRALDLALQDRADRTRSTVAGGDGAPPSTGTARRPRVLAVDDQTINLELLGRYFDHLGIDGALARSDEEAEARLAGTRFDLVLLDLHMPGRDGFEIARRLRAKSSPNRETPLVALTADAYADSHERALASGFDAVLTKPVTVDRLSAELQRRFGATDAVLRDAAGSALDGGRPAETSTARVERSPTKRAAGARDANRIVSLEACAAGMLGNRVWASGALESYRDEVPLHVETLRARISKRDRDGLFHAAHALKGVSDICRIGAVSDAARGLEDQACSADWSTIERLGDELVALLGVAASQCERELARADRLSA